MPAEHELIVENLASVQRAFAKADRDVRLGFRAELRSIGQPVADEAERLALSEIRRMPKSPKWAKMRVGVTRNLVYVAPRQRGVRWNKKNPFYRFSLRRPNLADLLMDRAMEPALEREAPHTQERVERMLDRVADRFNKGGHP